MKRSVILGVSLALNVGLLAGVYLLRQTSANSALPARPLRLASEPAAQGPASPAPSQPVPSASPAPGAAEHGMVPSFHWSQIASTNYIEYRDRLRAIGCPESTVRDILKAEIHAGYEQRRQPLVAEFQRQFWALAAAGTVDPTDPDDWREEEFERLDEERDEQLKSVLGADTDAEDADDFGRRRESLVETYGWLPPEKREALVALLENQERRVRELGLEVDRRGDGWTPADHARRQALAGELERARTQLLSPAELEEYRLRDSSGARWAQNLAGFEPTEEEWRAVAQLQQEYTDARQQLERASLSKEEKQARVKELRTELDGATRSTLGADRYAEVERAQDGQYQTLRRVMQRHGLTDEMATQVYDLEKTARDQIRRVNDQQDVPEANRAATLRALREETETVLRQTLGGNVFETYQEYAGGWLRDLGP